METTKEQVWSEIAKVAFAAADDSSASPLKYASKLRALEMLGRPLCAFDPATDDEPPVILDDLARDVAPCSCLLTEDYINGTLTLLRSLAGPTGPAGDSYAREVSDQLYGWLLGELYRCKRDYQCGEGCPWWTEGEGSQLDN